MDTLTATALAQAWDGHMWGWGWVALIWMVLFWGGVVALAVWIVGGMRSRDATSDPLDRPRRLLAERYARGEIDIDEYRERLDALG